jgi:hypothetical protein
LETTIRGIYKMRIIAMTAYVLAIGVLGYQVAVMEVLATSADALVVATLFLLIAQLFTGIANALQLQHQAKLDDARVRLHALQDDMQKYAAETMQKEKDETDKKDIN